MIVQKIGTGLMALFFCLIAFNNFSLNGENYVEKLYCSLLGNDEASCKYKEIIHEALNAFGVKEFKGVPVKKMGALPLRLIGDQYVSFTMDGIWLNEEKLADCPESEIIFILFHETAHYVHRDHGKQIISLLPAAWLFYIIPCWSTCMIDTQKMWARLGCMGAASIITIILLDHLFMRPIARHLDKNAELEATKILCSINKGDVVRAHINYLKSLLGRSEGVVGIWSHSLQERINYVTAYYNELSAQISQEITLPTNITA